jgi:hypothetical protein
MTGLDDSTLKSDLTNLFVNQGKVTEIDIETLVNTWASLIKKYVVSAEVTVIAKPGEISVVGSPSAQANTSPISLTGSLS